VVCTHETFKDGQRVPHRILVACDARIEQTVERQDTHPHATLVLLGVLQIGGVWGSIDFDHRANEGAWDSGRRQANRVLDEYHGRR